MRKFVQETIQDDDEQGICFNVLKVLEGSFVVRCTDVWKDEYQEKFKKWISGDIDKELFLSLPLNIPYYLEILDHELVEQRWIRERIKNKYVYNNRF